MKPRCSGGPPPSLVVPLLLLFCLQGALGFCPFRCLCNEDTLTVWCDGAALDVVPITLNPVLQELHLNGNRIKSISRVFNVYQNLRFLDMSQNQLPSLGTHSFLELKKLRVLHLNNNKIHSLKARAFEGLDTLKVLRLDGNTITEIEDQTFEPLFGLENLDLSRNSISNLSPGVFTGLGALKELLLRDNKLTRVPAESFPPLHSLRSLDLGMNYVYVVPKSSFHPLKRLQVLSLDGCGIHIIETGAFLGLDSIVSLFLQDNELQTVPTDVLLDIPFLQELHVGKNKLQRLGPEDFRGMRSLRTISVNGEDSLEVIENGTFADNRQLERLIISQNKELRHVDPGTFSGLDKLRFLSLRGNQFTTFREDMLPWGQLDAFDVRENPLICNCSLRWLWELLRRENFSSYGEDVTRVRCKAPELVVDHLLVDIEPEDMDCEGRDLRLVLSVVFSGAAALLAAAGLITLWHRYRYAARQKNKLGHSKRTLYQYGQNSDNFSPILSQIGQQPFKNPTIAEL